MSDTAFGWLLTAVTGGLAGVWLVYDAINLWRSFATDGADPVVRDKRFGYVIGMIIGIVGLVGCLRFHGVL
jgi:hypothetical protein